MFITNPKRFTIDFPGDAKLFMRPLSTTEEATYEKEIAEALKTGGENSDDAVKAVKVKWAKIRTVDWVGFGEVVQVDDETNPGTKVDKTQEIPFAEENKDRIPDDCYTLAMRVIDSRFTARLSDGAITNPKS